MRKFAFLTVIMGVIYLLSAPTVFAAGDLSKQDPITVRVDLLTVGDEHRFSPDELTFETGKLYKLVLHNPSEIKHYFTSYNFARSIWTRKVQVMDDVSADGSAIAEIKGAVTEVELLPGGTTEWWFVPIATGTFADLYCHIKDADGVEHADKGMRGLITVM